MDAHQRRRSYAARYPISLYMRLYTLTPEGKAALERWRKFNEQYLIEINDLRLAGKADKADQS